MADDPEAEALAESARRTADVHLPGRDDPPPWDRPGVRVYVNGSQHPIHDGATSARVTFVYSTGETAEVQVAKVADCLVVIAAGEVAQDRDPRGHTRLRVWPTK